jgi:hypothetical protein
MEPTSQFIEEALENHPAFSKKKYPQPYDKSEPFRNEIGFHPEVGMVVINSQKILILDVNSDKYITLNPQSRIHPMHGGIINPSGNLLAIQGNNQILLIALSEEAKLSFMEQREECDGDEIRCKSQVIQLGPIHNNEIRKISWHPISDTHLVVLTNDSLRLYNCHGPVEQPEQNFYLTDALDPISFSFGGSSYLDSWHRFTIFLLMRSGHIYAICPVVPYESMIPVEFLSNLQDRMRAIDDESAIRWLKEIKGPNIKVDFKSPIGIKRINKRGNSRFSPVTSPKTKKVFSSNFESDDDSVEEEPEEQEKGYVRTKKPHSFNNTLIVQGPLTENGSTTKFECTDILTLPTTPTVIMRSFEDAVIEIFLLFEDIHPKWGRENMFKKQKDQASFILYDHIDLGLPTHNSEMGPCRLYIGPNNSPNNYEFYAYHGAGVHRIKLSYMSLLSDSVFLDPLLLEKEGSVPQSEKSCILNTLPEGTGTGSRPVVFVGFTIATVKGKNLIVARDAEGNLHCASDSIAQVQKRFFNNSSDNISQQNKGMNIDFPQKVTKVSNLHFEKESQAIVYLIHQTEERMKNQLPALHKIELQLKDQLKSVTDSYKDQQSTLASAIDKKAAIAERYEQIHEAITQVQQTQKELTERLHKAMNTTMLLQKNLTRAEIKFHEELIGLKKQTSNQEQEVKLLTEQLSGMDFKENDGKTVVKSKERNILKILPIIEQEGDLLEGITKQTQDLQAEVLKLYGLSVL